MNEYFEDLLSRMASNERLPAKEGEMRSSSTHDISFMAHREAEEVCDLSLLAELEIALKKKNSKKRFRDLLYMLAHLSANTKSPDGIALFLSQFDRKDLNDEDRAHIALCATKCMIVQAKSFIGTYLDSDHWRVLTESLEYFQETGDDTYLSKICELLDSDCNGLCSPMYAIFALEKIGDKAAIPFLERFVERHKKARKADLKESRQYAKAALATLGYEKCTWEQNSQDRFSESVSFGNLARARTWIEAGADVNVADSSGWLPLCTAANSREVEMVRFLLDMGAKLTSHNHLGQDALMIASSQGSIEIVRLLCNRGANINAQAPDGTTALMEACKNGHVEVVRCLLQHGADINLTTGEGMTQASAIFFAASGGNHEAIEVLLSYEADVNDSDVLGQTPLIVAINESHLSAVETLISAGADVSKATAAINQAAKKGNDAIVDFIRSELKKRTRG